ncbi:MBL fold metallo-hydrolase [Deinococcus cavernae]|uniref:MBL fold metallo-hydrolase n=1 Tax=Deinococcus cavernae TaxID=2320857 RepID=A0A418V5P6_9DEIO|nr:MBL fold metallo-hydrolase [Deinococcus cavernae]RJF71431.1 MBL fold metallo-hydrolase [Deinococcus cavernae]
MFVLLRQQLVLYANRTPQEPPHDSASLRTGLLGLINTYLVPEKDGLTLIDTGMLSLVPLILKKAAQLGQPITRIVLTHGHDDHALGLDGIKRAYPGARVFMHQADAASLTRLNVETRPDRALQGGEQLGSLQVIAAPGHSEGHLAYLDPRDGTLYAGDAFVNVPSLRVATELHPLFPMPTFGTWNADAARASARTLTELHGLNWLVAGVGARPTHSCAATGHAHRTAPGRAAASGDRLATGAGPPYQHPVRWSERTHLSPSRAAVFRGQKC